MNSQELLCNAYILNCDKLYRRLLLWFGLHSLHILLQLYPCGRLLGKPLRKKGRDMSYKLVLYQTVVLISVRLIKLHRATFYSVKPLTLTTHIVFEFLARTPQPLEMRSNPRIKFH